MEGKAMFYKFEMTNHKHILFQRELVPLDDFLRILPNVSLGNSVGKSVNVLKTRARISHRLNVFHNVLLYRIILSLVFAGLYILQHLFRFNSHHFSKFITSQSLTACKASKEYCWSAFAAACLFIFVALSTLRDWYTSSWVEVDILIDKEFKADGGKLKS